MFQEEEKRKIELIKESNENKRILLEAIELEDKQQSILNKKKELEIKKKQNRQSKADQRKKVFEKMFAKK